MRFFVFAGWECYPNGGCGDYVGAFDTVAEAAIVAQAHKGNWAHVATVQDGELVVVWPPCEVGSA